MAAAKGQEMPRVVTKLSFQPVCLSRHRPAHSNRLIGVLFIESGTKFGRP